MPRAAEIITSHAEPNAEPAIPEANWKKELAEATISAYKLIERLQLETCPDLVDEHSSFRCLVTESFIKKMQPGNINDPLLRQVCRVLVRMGHQLLLTGRTTKVDSLARGQIREHGRVDLLT